MSTQYVIGIDQSTQGTKALLFGETGTILDRIDFSHEQIVSKKGWISHNPEEIYQNTLKAAIKVVEKNKINKNMVKALGISNQRETTLIWDKKSGKAMGNAIVWQCARANDICETEMIKCHAEEIQVKTGIVLSPFFPAAKIAWLLQNTKGAKEKAEKQELCHGTIDTWLIYRLTEGQSYFTDFSNASRTQLFNISSLCWDEDICKWFGIDVNNLAKVLDSNANFGSTTLEGFFNNPVPIHGVMGDSHAALFAQGCFNKGMIKATYGTGSSIMMNIGDKQILSKYGLVTSLGWRCNGKSVYVLEGNLNYTGAVVSWLKDKAQIIASPCETASLAEKAAQRDGPYFVPAFSGLGAPYWDNQAKAAIIGMDRTTGREEIVKGALECIAYQIRDVVKEMERDTGIDITELRVDGGMTNNNYLMQFQSDIINAIVKIPIYEELSAMGAAYLAGLSLKIWGEEVLDSVKYMEYKPIMSEEDRERKVQGWKEAVIKVLTGRSG